MAPRPERAIRPAPLETIEARPPLEIDGNMARDVAGVSRRQVLVALEPRRDDARSLDAAGEGVTDAERGERVEGGDRVARRDPTLSEAPVEHVRACRPDPRRGIEDASVEPLRRKRCRSQKVEEPVGRPRSGGERVGVCHEGHDGQAVRQRSAVPPAVRDGFDQSRVLQGAVAGHVNDQVAETLKFLAPEARSREVALGGKLNGAPLRINGDAIQLQQVLSNLILNGFDATSEAQSEKAVTVATRRNGRFAEISVADTGPGVSEEAAKKIFDPFFSTKDHGMGMGLSIVRTIVEAHNGHIEVENRNGARGAVFRVNLPLA